jgi:hypothetical protein
MVEPALMKDLLPLPRKPAYSPGGWAKASTLLAAAGWFVCLWLDARAGADLAQGAFLNVFAALILAIIPMFAGAWCWGLWNGSQKAGDIAFSIAMAAQGVALVVARLMI